MCQVSRCQTSEFKYSDFSVSLMATTKIKPSLVQSLTAYCFFVLVFHQFAKLDFELFEYSRICRDITRNMENRWPRQATIIRCRSPFGNFLDTVRYLWFVYIIFSFSVTLFPSPVAATPVKSHMKTLNDAFQTQDQICSVDHISGQGSYRQLVSTLAGLDLGILGKSKKIYTGFKFHRVYNFGSLFDKMQPSIKMTYCNQGKVQWQAEQKYPQGLDWNIPICVYTPTSVPSTVETNRFWKIFKTKQKSKAQPPVSHKQLASEDLDNLHCFKLARREKYYHRNTSIYLPNKWVGGLFYCNMDSDAKKNILNNMSEDLSLENLDDSITCDATNFIPLEPLISDGYSKHWTEVHPKSKLPVLRRISRTRMRKIVPFLHTPLFSSRSGNFSVESRTSTNESAPAGQLFSLANYFSWRATNKQANKQWFFDLDPEESYNSEDTDHAKTRKSQLENSLRKFENFLGRANLRGANIVKGHAIFGSQRQLS
ncbi:LAME_0B04786g1_1 [Lachancea meyersii CBS 8951]|uniref:LAME_0B04786g1_1 n=1 Tax=Lachancea meyersii CBS 8951 TaxID=1266667 RepID=A0A1G4IV94_9SACH|nr:LAME_0B04786g1_1 [Lachancea meyersii CBS 8951]